MQKRNEKGCQNTKRKNKPDWYCERIWICPKCKYVYTSYDIKTTSLQCYRCKTIFMESNDL